MNSEPIVWRVRNLPDLSTEMRQPGASRSMSNGKPGARGFGRFTADEEALRSSA
jgi:hypothetical protein